MIRIPDYIREFRTDWLTGESLDIQRLIRKGCCLHKSSGDYVKIIWHSGGAGTMCGENLDATKFSLIKNIVENELINFDDSYASKSELEDFLNDKGVNLQVEKFREWSEEIEFPSATFYWIKKIYELLPESHLGHEHFKNLRVGGWGNGAAKFSQYDDPTVHIYACAAIGAKRNLFGLLLHETGHSHQRHLKNIGLASDIEDCFSNLKDTDMNGIMLDYLYGINSRSEYVRDDLSEFLAEFYLLYVVQGTELKNLFKNMNKQEDLQRMYDLFQESFGVEYS